ncbi:MAG: GH92 family glycosyl hydrolase [Bacteroidota bacterium]
MNMRRVMHLTVVLLLVGHRAPAQDPTEFVDPFIGTSGGGNTYPGAVLPWGMVSVSPHNAPGAPSGYRFGEKSCTGFGHVHLSGTGCADLGSIIVTASRGVVRVDPPSRTCTILEERSHPGYYGAKLVEAAVRVEATATVRCGMTRFTSLVGDTLNVVISVGESLALTGGGSIAVTSGATAEGMNISGGFCGEANRQTVYCSVEFSKPSVASGTWVGDAVLHDGSASVRDTALGAWFRFPMKANEVLLVKIGISYVSASNARRNLEGEMQGWRFEVVRGEARNAWDRELSRVRVEGGSRDDRVKFYSALYHMLIHPNVISDRNGDYPLMGRSGVGRYRGRERYSVFSLWDTYRTLHPFLTLVYPSRQSAMLETMVDMARESGWLPKWELAGNETYMMVGDPASAVIADSYLKGIRDIDAQAAFRAMMRPSVATRDSGPPAVRPGYHEYLNYGYIPFEQDTTAAWWVWGPVSTTLEYCVTDWATAQMAGALGRTSDSVELTRRSLFYRNLFDESTGMIRPRRKDGAWLLPFDPLATEGSGSWPGSGGPGYVEGNAWHYTWFVPYDPAGLAAMFGGVDSCARALERCFSQGYFTINNEPDMGYPYFFNRLPGHEYRTAEIVREIMDGQFTNSPAGLPGNDDAGTMSAWYVFSALGFYPSCPGSPWYELGAPAFPKITLALDSSYHSGSTLVVNSGASRPNTAGNRVVLFNGVRVRDFRIGHETLTAGGMLEFR